MEPFKKSQKVQEQQVEDVGDFDVEPGQSIYDDYLDKIKMIESSGGKDISHPVMEAGIHAGQAAMGNYGIMPETARDLARKVVRAKTTLGESVQGQGGLKEVAQLAKLSDEALQQAILNNPKLERKLARLLAQEVHLKQGGDPERAAYAWTMGSNLGQIPQEKLESHPYVAKFRKLQGMVKSR